MFDPFPQLYSNPLRFHKPLQAALEQAMDGSTLRVALAIVALDPGGERPFAHLRGREVHYSASLVKVAAMYAAFELRRAALRLVQSEKPQDWLACVKSSLSPAILTMTANLPALSGVATEVALPDYAKVFSLDAELGEVKFQESFAAHIERMIVASDNPSSAACIHGLGYGYLNGSLLRAGFFDAKSGSGIWLGGDYIQGYPYFRISSTNDGMVAQASTVIDIAWLMTLMHDGQLVDAESSAAMLGLLARAATNSPRKGVCGPDCCFRVTHAKSGKGPLKPENGGQFVHSEGMILEHSSGHRFLVVYQDFIPDALGFQPLGTLLSQALDAYVAQMDGAESSLARGTVRENAAGR